MDVDPLASMRCWAIEIELGGHRFEVPPLPAADWWPVLVSADPTQILDMVVSTDDTDLDEMILNGEVTGEELGETLTQAAEESTGRSFWASCVLAIAAERQWATINGRLAKYGFRWDVMPIGAALDAIYTIFIEAIPEEREEGKRKTRPRDEFLALLDKPQGSSRDREKILGDFATVAGPKPTGGAVSKGEIPRGGVRSTGGPSGSARPKTPIRPRQPRPRARSRAPKPPPGQPG